MSDASRIGRHNLREAFVVYDHNDKLHRGSKPATLSAPFLAPAILRSFAASVLASVVIAECACQDRSLREVVDHALCKTFAGTSTGI